MSVSPRIISFNETPVGTQEIPLPFASFEELRFTLSPAMEELRRQVGRVAQVDVPVLLLGESGVGKEFVARALHARSPRSQNTFLKVNCAALPSEL